jgi:hypothetical protein
MAREELEHKKRSHGRIAKGIEEGIKTASPGRNIVTRGFSLFFALAATYSPT